MSDTVVNSGGPVNAGGRPQDRTMGQTLLRGLASPQLGALLTLAAGATLGIGLILWTLKPDYVPVAEHASRSDAVQVIESLKLAGIQYKVDPGSGLVLVPRDQAARIQIDLAAAGIGNASAVGLELLQEEQSLGTSQFTEAARYQHALETELARTVSNVRNIESARVHLAMPKQSVFVRDRVTPTASVMVKLMPGRTLEKQQVSAIVSMVASSIPYLETSRVTVIDQAGRLLSTSGEDASGDSNEQFEQARRLEKLYSERIEGLLTPIVGDGKVRAMVTADLDFSVQEQTEELFNGDPAKLRSAQEDVQTAENLAAQGIPGALANQPPGNGQVDQAGAGAANGEGEPGTERSSSTIRNYELDKTIRHVRQSPGEIRRLSAAVIVDDQVTIDEAGEVVRTPVTEAELAEYTALVREAMGFVEARGDTVAVFNRAFQAVPDIEPVEPLPIYEQPWLWSLARQVLVGLAVLLLVLLVLRPAVKRLAATTTSLIVADDQDEQSARRAGQEAGRRETQNGASSLDPPPVVYGDILNLARSMASEDPKRVAMLVKDWVKQP